MRFKEIKTSDDFHGLMRHDVVWAGSDLYNLKYGLYAVSAIWDRMVFITPSFSIAPSGMSTFERGVYFYEDIIKLKIVNNNEK